jgi:hypothetical protein
MIDGRRLGAAHCRTYNDSAPTLVYVSLAAPSRDDAALIVTATVSLGAIG